MDIDIKENEYGFNIEDLIVLGNRANNSKRNFLFISKVLGKHLEVKPNILRSIGYLLSNKVYRNNNLNIGCIKDYVINGFSNEDINKELEKSIKTNERVLIIGFSETATALGMSVASSLHNSYYVTTTREELENLKSFFNFEEEHSHATSHKCYLKDLDKLKNADRIILVDDEITTGNTMINLIKELNKYYLNKKYSILSIMDFRNQEWIDKCEKFKKDNNIDISVHSILSAGIKNEDNEVLTGDLEGLIIKKANVKHIEGFDKEIHIKSNGNEMDYLRHSGRFGVSFEEIRNIDYKAKEIADKIKTENSLDNKNILVLGHGEDMYIPSRVANFLGNNVYFKTTTRSPIFVKNEVGYPINERTKFTVDNINYYLYNKSILEKSYDKIILITEYNIPFELTDKFMSIKL